MLTNSRGQVQLERNERLSRRGNEELVDELGIVNSEVVEPTRRSTSYYSQPSMKTDEYSAVDIATKLFGSKVEEPTQEFGEDLENENLVPSIQTLGYSNPKHVNTQIINQTNRNIVVKTSSVSKTKAKIALASYIAVVLILAIAIGFTAYGASTAFAQGNQLIAELADQVTTIEAMEASLATVDEMAMISAAEVLGLELPSIDNTIMYSAPALREAQSFEVTSNWFDKLCDNLSNMFGGN